MDFPKNNGELDEIFREAKAPTVSEFSGDYAVDVLTGVVPSFRFAGHKKRMLGSSESKTGYNFFLKFLRFGNFSVERGSSVDFHNLEVVVFNYTNKGNIAMRRLRDKLRRVEDGLYLGRYYLLHHGEFEFEGYFSLKRDESRQ